MSRLIFALLGLVTLTLATGCCCGGGYGACRPNPCCGAAPGPVYGAAYNPIASTGCNCGY